MASDKRGDVEFQYLIAAVVIVLVALGSFAFAKDAVQASQFWKAYHLKNTGTIIMLALGANGDISVDYEVFPNDFDFEMDYSNGFWFARTHLADGKTGDGAPRAYRFGTDAGITFDGDKISTAPFLLSFYKTGDLFTNIARATMCKPAMGQGNFENKKIVLNGGKDIIRGNIEHQPLFVDATKNNRFVGLVDDPDVIIDIMDAHGFPEKYAPNQILFFRSGSGNYGEYFACLLKTKLMHNLNVPVATQGFTDIRDHKTIELSAGNHGKDLSIIILLDYNSLFSGFDESKNSGLIAEAIYESLEDFYK